MNYKPFNSTAGYSIGITQSTVIDSSGNIVCAGISASGGMTLAGTVSLNGQTFTNVVSSFNGATGAVTGVTVGGANIFTALNAFNAGISAAGATFTAPITSTRLARSTSAVFEAKTADWTPTNADDGKIFTVDIGKSTITCTLAGLSTGTHFKILVLSGTVIVETGDDLYGYSDVGTGDTRTIYCIGSSAYFGSV